VQALRHVWLRRKATPVKQAPASDENLIGSRAQRRSSLHGGLVHTTSLAKINNLVDASSQHQPAPQHTAVQLPMMKPVEISDAGH